MLPFGKKKKKDENPPPAQEDVMQGPRTLAQSFAQDAAPRSNPVEDLKAAFKEKAENPKKPSGQEFVNDHPSFSASGMSIAQIVEIRIQQYLAREKAYKRQIKNNAPPKPQ